MRSSALLKQPGDRSALIEADGEILQIEFRIDAARGQTRQRPIDGVTQFRIFFAQGDPDPFTEKTALEKRPTLEGAAIAGGGAVQPDPPGESIAKGDRDGA